MDFQKSIEAVQKEKEDMLSNFYVYYTLMSYTRSFREAYLDMEGMEDDDGQRYFYDLNPRRD